MPDSDRHEQRRRRLAAARLYLVCDALPGGRELGDVLNAAAAGGVDMFQLRDKRLSDDELASVAADARKRCEQLGLLLIVNDRPDVAAEVDADGVHLGQDDEDLAAVRDRLGTHMLIGLSTHTPEQVNAAGSADYIGVGPVHATPTKPGRPAVGLELVRHAAAQTRLPFFAIGGIDGANIIDVVRAGARRCAVNRAIADAADPQRAARTLRGALEAAEEAPGHGAP